jgi:hypothetical protein
MQRRKSGLFCLLTGAALLLPALPVLADPPAHAPAWGYRAHEATHYGNDGRDDRRYYGSDDRYDRYYGSGDRYYGPDERYDRRDRDCDHDRRHDGRRVYTIARLPVGYRTIVYRGDRYFYDRNLWYRPYGSRYVIVAPPAGLVFDRRGIAVLARIPIVH